MKQEHATVEEVPETVHWEESVYLRKVWSTIVRSPGQTTNTSEYYTGLTEGAFKYRLYGHNSSFKSNKQKNNTMLSKHVWWLKSNNIAYQLEWKILGKAKAYNPITKVCRLCLLEKYFIMYKPETATLNSRDEFFNPCRHKWKYMLSNS